MLKVAYPNAKSLHEPAILRAIDLTKRQALAARCLGGGRIPLGERLAVAAPRRVEPARVRWEGIVATV